MAEKKLRLCSAGHKYYKSSDCPVCPVCEKERVPDAAFLAQLSAPARRALERAGIKTLQQLSACTEKELLSMHGFGPASIPKLRAALTEAGLKFK
ncbi:MAG: RNA polymerase alpha subunit C-terminal domain-containing protein [Flavipsychrobacter sp.]